MFKLDYGKKSFLFTGDCTLENEEEILSYVENPLLGHDNIFDNELELRNIIIEN